MEKVNQLDLKVHSELEAIESKKAIIQQKLKEVQDTSNVVDIQRRKKVFELNLK